LELEVAKVALEAGVMYCPGAYTTSEIIQARAAGAHLVKVYPVGVAGGAAYIRVIRDPIPDVPMLAAGGTTLENFVPFLMAGCLGVGLGGSLADAKLADAGKLDEIYQRAKAFSQRLAAARSAGQVPETAPEVQT
jgi:2-dehydro-3-deoxyphosphogluconate aldolase/(4S)-4-hydroxy-2-oxoglutarate aldolase